MPMHTNIAVPLLLYVARILRVDRVSVGQTTTFEVGNIL